MNSVEENVASFESDLAQLVFLVLCEFTRNYCHASRCPTAGRNFGEHHQRTGEEARPSRIARQQRPSLTDGEPPGPVRKKCRTSLPDHLQRERSARLPKPRSPHPPPRLQRILQQTHHTTSTSTTKPSFMREDFATAICKEPTTTTVRKAIRQEPCEVPTHLSPSSTGQIQLKTHVNDRRTWSMPSTYALLRTKDRERDPSLLSSCHKRTSLPFNR